VPISLARPGRTMPLWTVLLLTVATAGTVAAAVTLPNAPQGTARSATIAMIVGQGVALLRARSAPGAASAVTLALGAALEPLIPLFGPGLAPAAVFALALHRRPRVSLWGLAAMVAAAPLALLSSSAQSALVTMAVAVATWSLGELLRSRIERRAEAVRAIAEQERAALAREVHDIVGHSLAMIIVQAGAADDVFEQRPERAREAVRAIDGSARSALDEVRRVIAGAGERHGLGDLDALAGELRAAGLTVRLRVDGARKAVPATVAASTYRIVQEAFTNTLRHAAAGRVDAAITCDAREVRITVRDDGTAGTVPRPHRSRPGRLRLPGSMGRTGNTESTGSTGSTGPTGTTESMGSTGRTNTLLRTGRTDTTDPSRRTETPPGGHGHGHGLAGMRARAELHGGGCEAGPLDEGGFEVRARLPFGDAR
jgi:signal transduction histidine kinase